MTADRRRYRICHINLAANFRGGERQTELLIRELAGRGWRQRLVVRAGGPLGCRCRDVADLEVIEVLSHPLTAALAARGVSLVHAHEARAVYAAWLLHGLRKTPYLLTRRVEHSGSDNFARRRAYRAAGSVVAISTSVANVVHAHYPDIHCRVIPSAHADLPGGHPSANALRARYNGRTVIGHIGALDHSHKGQGTIIEAARRLRATHPIMHFVLVGDGKDERRLREAASGLDNIEFAGFVENVADYLAVFDVFLYPSLREGLGSTLLDAMCFGLPIVASDVGGIPEIVEDQVNGLLIRPGNADDLVAALERVVGDAGLRERMCRENREKATLFGAPRMASSYEALYERLLADR